MTGGRSAAPYAGVMSTGEELRRRDNNLDALRLGGALLVVLGHSYVVLAKPMAPPTIFGQPLHALGVHVFFIISGHLITKSWQRRPDWRSYFAARALRIFPALIVAVVLTAFVVGTVFTTLPTSDYLSDPSTWLYLKNALLQPVFGLPGVFVDLPYPYVLNGSLWTLPVEFACYLVVPLVLLLPRRLHVPAVGLFALISIALHLRVWPDVDVLGFFTSSSVGEPWIFFAGGMLCALLLERHAFRLDVALLGLFAVTIVSAVDAGLGTYVLWAVLPYSTLALGLASTPVLRRASRYGDFSYGLYIYAFPVQQVVVATLGVRGIAANAVAVVVATLVLAALSWHLVEAPALRVKTRFEKRFPARRGRRAAVPRVLVGSDVDAGRGPTS